MRPDHITDLQIYRWDQNIEEDENIPDGFKKEALLKEILYSGLYLGEELNNFSCPPHRIIQLQYEHGYQSFGRNCWEVAHEILNKYKSNGFVFDDDEPSPESN